MEQITPEVAEIAGIFAADGSMQKEHICFWGNITEDKDYYDNIIKGLFRKAFGIEVRPHEKKSNSVYGFYICNKEIIEFFNKTLGFKFGNKTYTVRIPEIVINSKNPRVWGAFVRGFCDCDGSLNFDKRYNTCQEILKTIHTYPRIQIKSVSHELIKEISKLLVRLKLEHTSCTLRSKKENEMDCGLIELKGEKRLEHWMEFVGFDNPVQQTRYEIFKRYGFVPINTSLSQRKEILKGSVNPWDLYPKWTRSLAWIRRQDKSCPARAF